MHAGFGFSFVASVESETNHSETMVKVSGVEQSPGLPSLLQGRQHDLGPKGGVEADDLLNIAEQLGGFHLRQQAALLQVQQPTQEQLQEGRHKKSVSPEYYDSNLM